MPKGIKGDRSRFGEAVLLVVRSFKVSGMTRLNLVLLLLIGGHALGASVPFTRKSEELFPSDCGKQPLIEGPGTRHKRLVNANYTSFGEFPWHVLIHSNGTLVCSGVLINANWVLTKAQCADSLYYGIRLGEHDKMLKTEPLEAIERSVARIVRYPKFVREKLVEDGYDIALLKLSKPVQFQPHIQPICLPKSGEDVNLVGRMAEHTGWGTVFYNDREANVLQKVSIPILDNETCIKLFADANDPLGHLHDSLCAGFSHAKVSSCQGDAGGPLQIQRPDNQWTAIGLLSWSRARCSAPNDISVFIRISHYIPWIRRELMSDWYSSF